MMSSGVKSEPPRYCVDSSRILIVASLWLFWGFEV